MILIFYCIMQSRPRFQATKSLLSRLITRISGVLPALLFSVYDKTSAKEAGVGPWSIARGYNE